MSASLASSMKVLDEHFQIYVRDSRDSNAKASAAWAALNATILHVYKSCQLKDLQGLQDHLRGMVDRVEIERQGGTIKHEAAWLFHHASLQD